MSSETSNDDWRVEIANYLRDPSQKVTRKLRYKSAKYILLDDQLYYKIVDGVLLKCLNQEEAKVLMGEVLWQNLLNYRAHMHLSLSNDL